MWRLKKLSDHTGAKTANKDEAEIIGTFLATPSVGYSFILYSVTGDCHRHITSHVEEVIDEDARIFKTKNSTYQLEEL